MPELPEGSDPMGIYISINNHLVLILPEAGLVYFTLINIASLDYQAYCPVVVRAD
jgi:hypothetical protein